MTADQELSIAYHFADLTDPRIDRSVSTNSSIS